MIIFIFIIGMAVGGLAGIATMALLMHLQQPESVELDPYQEEFNEYR